jgi:D-beta-D-heptose 7-phosphate kinase/D-beta-D-heptose 1-phosphate adenosyltransferase
LKEFNEACEFSRPIEFTDADFMDKAKQGAFKLFKEYNIKNLLVTMSEHGMIMIRSGKTTLDSMAVSPGDMTVTHMPAEANEVADVSGAGDTSLAAFGISLAAGLNTDEAMRVANAAAGEVVRKIGTATVTRTELVNAMQKTK